MIPLVLIAYIRQLEMLATALHETLFNHYFTTTGKIPMHSLRKHLKEEPIHEKIILIQKGNGLSFLILIGLSGV